MPDETVIHMTLPMELFLLDACKHARRLLQNTQTLVHASNWIREPLVSTMQTGDGSSPSCLHAVKINDNTQAPALTALYVVRQKLRRFRAFNVTNTTRQSTNVTSSTLKSKAWSSDTVNRLGHVYTARVVWGTDEHDVIDVDNFSGADVFALDSNQSKCEQPLSILLVTVFILALMSLVILSFAKEYTDRDLFEGKILSTCLAA